MDEKIDIRSYPIPNWSARQLSSMQNGKWTYFYNSRNNEPVFDFKPYSKQTLSIVPQRSPGGITNRSSNLKQTMQSKENDNLDHYDSYQLFQQSLKKEKMQQQIFLTPTFSKSEKKQLNSKTLNTKKLNETFVPSETNIVDEIRPIIPLTPGMTINKNKNENLNESKNNNDCNNDDEKNDENIYFSMKRNDAKNHNAFYFYNTKPKTLQSENKTKKLIDENIFFKKTPQSISQLKTINRSDQHAFVLPKNNQKRSQSSIAPTKK